ncbi:MAG: hypothetical protein HY769_09290 [Candidatus Stahlbacteria bacterium]|nr:hypothetical protein [Candidatus Stahlbacteria bacterium]
MKRYNFIIVGIFIFSSVFGVELKDFWDAKNCILRDAAFSEGEANCKVDYTVLRTPEGAAIGNEFCVFDGSKEMFTPLSYAEPSRLDDKRLSLEAPRTVKQLQRGVERAKETGEKQRALEYGYLIPIFMDVIFPAIKKYATPPQAILDALSKNEGLIYDLIFPVEVSNSDMRISSTVATRKPGEKPGTSLEEQTRWHGGAFGVPWSEVLPAQYQGGRYYEGTARAVETMKNIRISYNLLDSMCIFPRYFPGKEEGEMDRWVRKATPNVVCNFAWRKDMFNSLMEIGYFASFYAKYIFPIVQKKVEIPERFKKEGFLLTYFTEADINALVVWATAEGLDEKWKGARYVIPWDEAMPEILKKDYGATLTYTPVSTTTTTTKSKTTKKSKK